MIMSRNKLGISSIQELIYKHHTKVRFILVGIWNTIFGYLVFLIINSLFANIFTKRYFTYMSAMILSQIIAIINAFIFHKYITFKSKVKGKGMIIEFFRFCLTYVVAFALNLILLPFLVEIFKIQPKISAAIVILICTVISYAGHSRFSFKDEE
jgi:putative flippase GtrA